MRNEGDQDSKWLWQAGGISGVAIGLGYLLIIGLYLLVGAPPRGVEERLAHLAAPTTAWWWILGLSVLTDLLFVPLSLALYNAMRDAGRSLMLLAMSFVALFVFLDLVITWTNYAALITLSGKYAGSSGIDRAAVIAAAAIPMITLESKLLFVYNSLTLAIGMVLTGLVMLKARFGKASAYLGIAAGWLGTVSVVASFFVTFLDSLIILVSLLTMIWALVAGNRLYLLGRR